MKTDPDHLLSFREADSMTDRQWSIRASNRAAEALARVATLADDVRDMRADFDELKTLLIAYLESQGA